MKKYFNWMPIEVAGFVLMMLLTAFLFLTIQFTPWILLITIGIVFFYLVICAFVSVLSRP